MKPKTVLMLCSTFLNKHFQENSFTFEFTKKSCPWEPRHTYQCECIQLRSRLLTPKKLPTENNAFKCKNNLPLYARSFTIPL